MARQAYRRRSIGAGVALGEEQRAPAPLHVAQATLVFGQGRDLLIVHLRLLLPWVGKPSRDGFK